MKRAGVLLAVAAALVLPACSGGSGMIGDPTQEHAPYGGLRDGEMAGNREMRQLHGGGQPNPNPETSGVRAE